VILTQTAILSQVILAFETFSIYILASPCDVNDFPVPIYCISSLTMTSSGIKIPERLIFLPGWNVLFLLEVFCKCSHWGTRYFLKAVGKNWSFFLKPFRNRFPAFFSVKLLGSPIQKGQDRILLHA
jgi:hypothetical protein